MRTEDRIRKCLEDNDNESSKGLEEIVDVGLEDKKLLLDAG